MAVTLSSERARRIALAAQGFNDPAPSGRVDVRHFRRVMARIGVVQIDSVNVLARAHYLPFFSRLGAYDRAALDRWLWESGEVFEYWGHEASLLPVEQRAWFVHRMEGGWHWKSVERLGRDHPGYVESILEEVRRRGPLVASEVDGRPSSTGTWWEWGQAKVALEYLFLTGRVAVAGRPGFVRRYDVPERVFPPEVLARDPLPAEEARKRMLLQAARSHGVATAHDLADYYRIRVTDARPLLELLGSEGSLERVEVEGWDRPAYLHPEAAAPRQVEGSALLSPFDPVVWFRPRARRLFGFEYRIEIYVPAPRRVYGYYVLPFLHHDALVARVDLKADRKAGSLLVRSAHAEEGVDRAAVAAHLAVQLERLAAWLGLDDVRLERRGDLAGALAHRL